MTAPSEQKPGTPDTAQTVSTHYDRIAKLFSKADSYLWWLTIGQSAFDQHLGHLYRRGDIRIGDFGCASGRVINYLTRQGIPQECFVGIEISPVQANMARSVFPRSNIITGDISQPHITPNSLDAAYSNMVMEFLDPDQLRSTCAHIHTALKQRGKLLIITTHPEKMAATIKQQTDTTPESGQRFRVPYPHQSPNDTENFAYNVFKTTQDYRLALKDAGFADIIIKEVNIPPEAASINPKEYARYHQTQFCRLVITATKPDPTNS